MRNPEMTKKTSTPTNPPTGQPNACAPTTASTARARRPWMSRRGSEEGGDEAVMTWAADQSMRALPRILDGGLTRSPG